MELEYLKALDAPKYAAFREFNVEDPAPGTLKWFLHDELVSSWISKEESSSLWIRGSPGQGKTVLSKFILDHVEKLAESYRSVKVIYFFFSDRDECFRTASSLLRSLLKQLLATSDLFRHVSDIVRTDSSTDSEDSLWEVLEATFHAPTFSKIYCIIDALDECDEGSRGWLLRRIAKLAQVSAQKQGRVLKLFVTSRPVVDIARKLNSFPCINLRANPSDLKLLIDSRVATLGNFGAELQEYAAQLLLSRAGRTFLWVSIVLRQLSKISLPSKAEVRRIIETSPTDLDELYRTIIDRIMKGNPSQQKLLVWVVYGQRPLTLEELKAALATQIDSRNKASTEEYQISLSAKTIAEDAGVILEITHGKVHLIHQSAKDFLIKNGQLKSASFCNNQDPSIYLAKVCIAYLSFEDFETGPCHDEQALAIRKRQYPLFHYAARNWHAHVPKNGVDAVAHMLDRLIKPQSPILLSWGEAAGIPDIRQATDEIGVAGKTNIDWLADFHSSNVIITKAKVMEAAKNWSTGFEMMKKFANSGDVQFDEGALRALISCFGTDMMQHLLNKGHQFDVTHDLIKEIIANRMTGKFVMRAILHQWNDAVLTAELVKSAAEDSESGKDILEMLLRKQDINITEEAFAAIIRHFDAQLLSSVPDGKRDIKVTEKVVEAAAVHEDRNEMMQQLLKRTDWEITDRAVVAIVRLFSTVGVEYLLRSDVTITQAAAESLAISCNAKVMKLLLESRKPIQFTEAFVGAAASNKFYGEQVMKLLLTRANIPITETVVRAAAVNSGSGKEVLELLLRMGDIRTMEIVAKISPVNIAPGELLSRAVENGYEVLARQLLDRRGTDANSKDCEGWTPLVRAARKGDIGLVETLLHAKADVNVAITCGHRPTALEAAAEDGHLDVVERLLAAGADVNAAAARRHGRTALQAAAGGGYSDVVERLLAAGADANAAAARRHGRSALQGAAGGGHLGVVERLLAAGADVNAGPAEQYGRTALQAAAGGGHLDVVERLLAAGAGVNAAVEAYGRIALQLAAEGGHFDVVERLLVAGAEVNVTYGRTALQAAAEGGHLNVVERLLAAGAGVNVVAKYSDWAALRAAAGGGHLDVVERLLAAGADVNAASIYEGWTALQAAAGGGYLDVVERLLAARADANTTADGNMVGQSLQAAAGVGHLNALEKLLVAEADVNPTPEYVQTALQAAAGGGHLDIVERLLAAGADVNTTAIFGNQTALQEAAGGGHLDVVERLLAAGADVNTTAIFSNQTALQEAAGGGHLDVVERLLAAGADVNATATFGNQRALQEAARGGHLDVVERLLAAEADVNATAGYGDLTALQEAAGGGHLDVVERLLAAGANVNVVGIFFEGRTTLQAAAGGGYLDVVERLLAAGADVNAAAARKHGRTALQAAAGGGHLNVVERLLADQADVNADAAEEYGRTALQAAAGGGYLDVVERLLAAGADVNAAAAEKHGRTALQAAAGGGHLDAVERLRQAGAT
jgi:ankyrin repeat protein